MSAARDKFEPISMQTIEHAMRVLDAFERLPQLLQVEERLESSMDLLRGWVWETDSRQRLVYVGERASAISGLAVGDILGRTPAELGMSVCDAGEERMLSVQMAAQATFGPVDHIWHTPAGVVPLRLLGAPRFDTEKTFVGYRGIAMISSSAAAERERERETSGVF